MQARYQRKMFIPFVARDTRAVTLRLEGVELDTVLPAMRNLYDMRIPRPMQQIFREPARAGKCRPGKERALEARVYGIGHRKP